MQSLYRTSRESKTLEIEDATREGLPFRIVITLKKLRVVDLHAHDSITGKMVWFSYSKARELLKRRHLPPGGGEPLGNPGGKVQDSGQGL